MNHHIARRSFRDRYGARPAGILCLLFLVCGRCGGIRSDQSQCLHEMNDNKSA